MRRLAGAALAGLVLSGASAAAQSLAPPKPPVEERCRPVVHAPGTPDIGGGDIFGFTSGSELGDPCVWGYASENSFRAGRRDGSYFVLNHKSELSYNFTDRFGVSVSIFKTYTNWSDTNAAINGAPAPIGGVNLLAFDGFSMEPYLQLLRRSPGQPFGIMVSAEPRWARVDALTGLGATSYGAEFKLLVDVVLARHWFAAVNATYSLGTQKFDAAGSTWQDSSQTLLSGALTHRIYEGHGAIDEVFIGVEGRFLSAYAGTGMNQFSGSAFFFGPTIAISFWEKHQINAVWTPQVFGAAAIPSAPGRLDLDNFDAHQFRIKYSVDLN